MEHEIRYDKMSVDYGADCSSMKTLPTRMQSSNCLPDYLLRFVELPTSIGEFKSTIIHASSIKEEEEEEQDDKSNSFQLANKRN